MYFCSQCLYLLDINKYTNDPPKDEKKETITKLSQLFKLISSDDDINQYISDISKEEVIANKKYSTLSPIEKDKIELLYEDKVVTNAEFKCYNCNFSKPIKKTTLLYQTYILNKNQNSDETDKLSSLEENKFETTNPILPHTRDYTCRNTNCQTHKNAKLKDAVFFHAKNLYTVIYICCVCYTKW